MQASKAGAFSVLLFGPLEIRIDGHPVPPLRSRKGQWLLALLALRHDRETQRDWLATTLWPDSPEETALANLRRSLTDLRQALGSEQSRLLASGSRTIELDLAGADVDVIEFDACVASKQEAHLLRAAELYRGPLLEGCAEEWAAPERQQREAALLEALETVAASSAAHGDLSGAMRHLRRLILIDPLRESAQCDLMDLLHRMGDTAAAIQVYRELRVLLLRELNASPAARTVELYERIRQEAGRPAAVASAVHLRRPPPSSRFSALGDVLQAEWAELWAGSEQSWPDVLGGAQPLDSRFYIHRSADDDLAQSIARRTSIILVNGARQMGKTSLLARGLQHARSIGATVLLTDFQAFDAAQFQSVQSLCLALAAAAADQLELDVMPQEVWKEALGANMNLDRFVRRHVLGACDGHLVWGMDQADRLLGCALISELFGLFRSWHNRRSLDPQAPWSRLTLIITYATEAHRFIVDTNQSPFNVGFKIQLSDLTQEQVAELNRRYAEPLKSAADLARFYNLLGGQPYLTQRGLGEMARRGLAVEELERSASLPGGPFGDHLRRVSNTLEADVELLRAALCVLRGEPCPTEEAYYRLTGGGIIGGVSARTARMRCKLYEQYLEARAA